MSDLPLKGVNLGGWLLLEKWITPRLFTSHAVTDEYTYCLTATSADLERLAQHHATWITHDDFVRLAEAGIEAVRLPVGYWLWGDHEPYMGTIAYVDKALQWAGETGLKVLVDLHGAPGSQNGWDHSGRAGNNGWRTDAYVAETLMTVQRLVEHCAKQPALLGIQLLNEPNWDVPQKVLEQYYSQAYEIARAACGPDVWVVFSDAFRPFDWAKSLNRKQFPGLYQDNHHFQVFAADDKQASYDQHIRRAERSLPAELIKMQQSHPVIIGEWSAALSDQSLSGRVGKDLLSARIAFTQAQLAAFQSVSAWFFWTYKTEARGPWNFRAGIEDGWLSI